VAWTPHTIPQAAIGAVAWVAWVLLVVRPHEWEWLLRRAKRFLPARGAEG